HGQLIALVIAETLEHAQAAAAHVHVAYRPSQPVLVMEEAPPSEGPAASYSRGDPEGAFRDAPVQIDVRYTTPVETHNPMAIHGRRAVWKGGEVRLYETTQGVVNHRQVVSEMLGIPVESVHIISPFVGSGFGSKLFPWPQSLLAAIGARHVGRPLKLSLT